MLRILLKLVPILLLCGCGGGLPESLPAGFLNETRHSDEQLWTIWKTAQQILSQRVDLNPLQRSMSGAKADIHPGDSRALQVKPHQLLVSPEVDPSWVELSLFVFPSFFEAESPFDALPPPDFLA